MFKHTPAPWAVVVDAEQGMTYLVAESEPDGLTDVSGNFFNPADAKLIAAAPDLLAALMLLASGNLNRIANHPAAKDAPDLGVAMRRIAADAVAKAGGAA